MTKRQYLDELEAQLYFLDEAERADALREFESHIDDTAASRADLSEDQVVERLPPPASVAARYYAESSDSAGDSAGAGMGGQSGGERGGQGRGEGRHGGRRGFSLGDLGSMFRFARREEREASGAAAGVERLEIRAASCDILVRPGEDLAWSARGRWADGDEPEAAQDGARLVLRCERDVDELEVRVPAGLVELIVASASGDLSVDLPAGASLGVRTASGDVSCSVDGGSADITTASGDVNLRGRPSGARVSSASGDLCLTTAGDLEAATQSGDISVSALAGDAEILVRSMSGDVSVSLPAGSRPEIAAETVSGDVSAPGARVRSGPGSSAAHAEGGPGRVVAKSVSGDVSVH